MIKMIHKNPSYKRMTRCDYKNFTYNIKIKEFAAFYACTLKICTQEGRDVVARPAVCGRRRVGKRKEVTTVQEIAGARRGCYGQGLRRHGGTRRNRLIQGHPQGGLTDCTTGRKETEAAEVNAPNGNDVDGGSSRVFSLFLAVGFALGVRRGLMAGDAVLHTGEPP